MADRVNAAHDFDGKVDREVDWRPKVHDELQRFVAMNQFGADFEHGLGGFGFLAGHNFSYVI